MPSTTLYRPLTTTTLLLLATTLAACANAEFMETHGLPLAAPAGSDGQALASTPVTTSPRPSRPDTHVETIQVEDTHVETALPKAPDTHVVSTFAENPDTHIHTSEIAVELTVVGAHVSQDGAAGFRASTRPAASVPCNASDADMRASMLSLIGAARASARSCGNVNFAATSAPGWSDALQRSAKAHSIDMSTHNFFAHVGNDGRSVSDRVTDERYAWKITGENIAAGQRDSAEVVAGWLASPGHCANIMNPRYTTLAVACSSSRNADLGRYWTAVFAAPL